MEKSEWTKFVVEMTVDQESERENRNSLNSLTNHFERELKELVAKYEGKFNLHIEVEEITPC